MAIKMGDIRDGMPINEMHYFNGQLLSSSTSKTIYWVVSILGKHIEALKDAIVVWKQRKQSSRGSEKSNAQSNLDYLESQLQKEIETKEKLNG